ncbi:carbohydrate ABC transporter permease [Paenibacillus sp. KQZ6P-2]|uniref:Carbohydrate ABC transporter permease n=1 Tax=Paenibacillus mangrovi TaxID=2931978 RepID=A0A9X1WY24_9BACL|nr:carbohydrate ABC transporter permease [Paenibacillus mangrovi]MCJ8014194.1 carbohydrate ABC transporter permease [Paenibacillus mangrovi]
MKRGFKRTKEDYIIDGVVYTILILVMIVTIYPFYYSFIISLNNGIDASRGGIFLWPRVFSWDNYAAVFSNEQLIKAYGVTITRTLVGTVCSVTFTALVAYSLAHKDLMFKNVYFLILIVAMYFSGGLIPYFILIKKLHLMNTFAVYIIPDLLSVFNVIIMMTFFRELPEALKESARIDGASDMRTFFKIMVPISAPVFATIALFNGVHHWNAWFDSAYFVTDKNLKTVSFQLMELINKANLTAVTGTNVADAQRSATYAAQTFTAESIRMATMITVVVPIICVYPFLQKYFVKGIMVGSVKG